MESILTEDLFGTHKSVKTGSKNTEQTEILCNYMLISFSLKSLKQHHSNHLSYFFIKGCINIAPFFFSCSSKRIIGLIKNLVKKEDAGDTVNAIKISGKII